MFTFSQLKKKCYVFLLFQKKDFNFHKKIPYLLKKKFVKMHEDKGNCLRFHEFFTKIAFITFSGLVICAWAWKMYLFVSLGVAWKRFDKNQQRWFGHQRWRFVQIQVRYLLCILKFCFLGFVMQPLKFVFFSLVLSQC